jgi:hypothetical protein
MEIAMSDELDRLRGYVRSLPAAEPEQLRTGRNRLKDEFAKDGGAAPRAAAPSSPWPPLLSS